MEALANMALSCSFAEDSLIVEFQNRAAALQALHVATPTLAQWASRFQKQTASLRYSDRRSFTIRAGQHMTPTSIITQGGLAATELVLSPGFEHVIGYLLSDPSKKAAIVRCSDERQIMVTQSMGADIKSATPLEATRRTRSDYWHPGDHADFKLKWQTMRVLQPNEVAIAAGVEEHWRGFDPVTGGHWRQFHSSLKLIEVGGDFYHLTETIGSPEAIATPV
jgi:hypothetical protein